jgi:hypothetical protein
LRAALLVAAYPVGAVFLAANWQLPGMPLVGLGAALNLLAISVNGGVIPASLLPVFCRGAALTISRKPPLDNGLPVPVLPTDLHTRRPGALEAQAAHGRQRHLQHRCDLLLRQQALVIAHRPTGHAVPRFSISSQPPGHHWMPGSNGQDL